MYFCNRKPHSVSWAQNHSFFPFPEISNYWLLRDSRDVIVSRPNPSSRLITNHQPYHDTPTICIRQQPFSIPNINISSRFSLFHNPQSLLPRLSVFKHSPLVLASQIWIQWASSKFSSSSLTAMVFRLQLAKYRLLCRLSSHCFSTFVYLLLLNRTSCDSLCKEQVQFVEMGDSSRIILSKGTIAHLLPYLTCE